MSLEGLLNVGYVMLLEGCDTPEEAAELERALHSEPTTLAKVATQVVIEGDEIVPTMVPSWWTGDEDAIEEAQGFQRFVEETGGGR